MKKNSEVFILFSEIKRFRQKTREFLLKKIARTKARTKQAFLIIFLK